MGIFINDAFWFRGTNLWRRRRKEKASFKQEFTYKNHCGFLQVPYFSRHSHLVAKRRIRKEIFSEKILKKRKCKCFVPPFKVLKDRFKNKTTYFSIVCTINERDEESLQAAHKVVDHQAYHQTVVGFPKIKNK